MPSDNALRRISLTRINAIAREAREDVVAVEEPLELRIAGRSIVVLMRTPGHDRELAAGFLATEGIVSRRDELLDLVYCGDGATDAVDPNALNVVLSPDTVVDPASLSRHLFTSSSCGICSRVGIERLRDRWPAPPTSRVPAAVLASLPGKLAAGQPAFEASGGLHAAGLFTAGGDLVVVREDVGRHNAVDKVLGHAFLAGDWPVSGRLLAVSGRVSFEIVQKGLAAGISALVAISAPTSAAVAFARECGITLIGFVRPGAPEEGFRMNVYAGEPG